MYCAGRERAAQPGAPALPAAGAVRGGGYQGNRFAFPGARRLCPRAVRPPDLPRALGRSSCCSRSGTSREGRDGSDKPMCGQRSCWAASTCCPGKQPSESRLCENKRGLGQAGLGAGRAWPVQDQTIKQQPQLQVSTVALGKVPTVAGHATPRLIMCGFQLCEGTDSSTSALGAAGPPGHVSQPTALLQLNATGRGAGALESQAQAPVQQLHARGSGFPEVCRLTTGSRDRAGQGGWLPSPTHDSTFHSIPGVSPHSARRGPLMGPICSCSP